MSRDACDRTGAFARVGVVRAHTDGTEHSPEAHDTISSELVRLTLGGRGPERPELLVGPYAALYAVGVMVQRFVSAMRHAV